MNEKPLLIISIHTPYIQLGQLLKLIGVVDHGAEAKGYLSLHRILVNGEAEVRRGRKLYPAFTIDVEGTLYTIQAT